MQTVRNAHSTVVTMLVNLKDQGSSFPKCLRKPMIEKH